MTALELLATLHERGVALLPWVDDRLRVDAPQGVLTDELRQAIRTQKKRSWPWRRRWRSALPSRTTN
jgi:TubC N-terminal docking domain